MDKTAAKVVKLSMLRENVSVEGKNSCQLNIFLSLLLLVTRGLLYGQWQSQLEPSLNADSTVTSVEGKGGKTQSPLCRNWRKFLIFLFSVV